MFTRLELDALLHVCLAQSYTQLDGMGMAPERREAFNTALLKLQDATKPSSKEDEA